MCRKNNLSFCELLSPFARLDDGKETYLNFDAFLVLEFPSQHIYVFLFLVSFKDPSGNTIKVSNLRISFSNMNSPPLPVTKERSRLLDSVNVTSDTCNITVNIGNRHSLLLLLKIFDVLIMYVIGGRELIIPENTPWFTKWRTTFLQIQNVSDHEYTRHFLGCILFKNFVFL